MSRPESSGGPRYPGESDEAYWFRQGVDYAKKCRQSSEGVVVKIELRETAYAEIVSAIVGQRVDEGTYRLTWIGPIEGEE